jgi:hypothetical protein
MKIVFFVLSCLLVCTNVFGQDWGKVSAEELAMTGIKEDPEADAVILFDKGEIITTADLDMVFKRHCRIKILTEQGKEYADIKVSYWHEDHVLELEAQSFLPDGKKTKLPANAIYDQEQEDFKYKTFAIPAVEVGSVIEYRYEIQSKYIHYLEPWYFQHEEYTRFSEIKLTLTEGLSFNSFRENMVLYNPIKTEGTEWDLTRKGKRAAVHTWQLSDIPALKSEPFMYSRYDYLAFIHFQLVSYQDENTNYMFIKTWDNMAKEMSGLYKEFLAPNDKLKSLALDLIRTDSTDISKIKSIYDFVCAEIFTEDYRGYYRPDYKKPVQVVETKKGNPVEKNLLLINLLKNAGIQAYPVMISTRSNGKFKPAFITTTQFNYLLAAVSKGEEYILLDSREKYCPYGALPDDSVVPYGFLFDNEKGKLLNLPKPGVPSGTEISSEVIMEKNGKIILNSDLSYTGYAAVDERSNFGGTGAKDYLQKKLDNLFIGAQLDSVTISNLDDPDQPFSVHIRISIPDYFQTVDKLVYFTPPYLSKQKSNPFKSEKRDFPVDYPYASNNVEKIKFKIPAGFTLSETPPKAKMVFQGISFNLFSLSIDNEIEIQRIFKLGKESYPALEYKNLRQVYNEMVSADQKQIIFNTK